MKPLILYYSYGGNTKTIAEFIQQETDGDLVQLEPAVAYSDNYDQVVRQGEDEVQQGVTPALKPLDLDWEAYDTVILGTPVWWYTFAPVVRTFLTSHDFSGKTIYPFATNGGWLGHTFRDVEQACPGATVQPGLNVRFDGSRLRTAPSEISRWLEQIKK